MAKWFETDFTDSDRQGGFKADSTTNRFWIPTGKEVDIIFLNEDKFILWEHNWYTPQRKFRNWASCAKMIKEPCPLCALDVKRRKVGISTIIDCNEWTDSRGNEHSHERKFFVATAQTWDLIDRRREKILEEGNSWVGACIHVYRAKGDKIPGVGNDFQYLKTVDLATLKARDIEVEPFDIETIFYPDVATLQEAAGGLKNVVRDKEEAPKQNPKVDYE